MSALKISCDFWVTFITLAYSRFPLTWSYVSVYACKCTPVLMYANKMMMEQILLSFHSKKLRCVCKQLPFIFLYKDCFALESRELKCVSDIK